jgi:hypothetical protein
MEEHQGPHTSVSPWNGEAVVSGTRGFGMEQQLFRHLEHTIQTSGDPPVMIQSQTEEGVGLGEPPGSSACSFWRRSVPLLAMARGPSWWYRVNTGPAAVAIARDQEGRGGVGALPVSRRRGAQLAICTGRRGKSMVWRRRATR